MRYRLLSAGAYLLLMTLWVYGVLDASDSGLPWLLPAIAALQVAAGFLIGRWPALVLPVFVALISVPAGYPPVEGGEPFPIWFDLAFLSVFAIPLVAVGVIARKIYDWRTDSRVAT